MHGLPAVSSEQALKAVLDGALLLDVRETQEWEAGHAPQARHIPLGKLIASLASIPMGRQIMVICRSGNRSRAAVEVLTASGHLAFNVEGGMREWAAAGGDVVTNAGTAGSVI
jgi:rhodanese-related sulfurtransferase